jgi:16S rRNA (guanine966-N2)-methyltransferase
MSDRAREGLFSSLGRSVVDARVLDLYAGTGALGIEALSRGARHATFVDHDPASLRAVRENLERTRLSGDARVVRAEAVAFVSRKDNENGAFDLVFLDPPFAEEGRGLADVLAALARGRLASSGWTVVLTRGRRSSMPVIPLNWPVARRLAYGDTLVFVYREV